MSTASRSPVHTREISCPLCEGRGQLPEDVLVNRLSEKDLANKIKTYLVDFVDAEEVSKPGRHEINASNLWRRSPKE